MIKRNTANIHIVVYYYPEKNIFCKKNAFPDSLLYCERCSEVISFFQHNVHTGCEDESMVR